MPSLAARIESAFDDAVKDAQRAAEFQALMSKADSIRDTVVAGCDKKRKKLSALRKEAKEAQGSGGLSEEEASRLTVRLDEADGALQQARRLRPVTGSLFIRLFLGSVNVKVSHEEDRKKLKEEYNKFKSRTNLLFILIPLSWAANIYLLSDWLSYTHWITVFGHIWLLYYYVTLALRENILRVNGSRIMSWWIVHHYISAAMSIVMLTWPFTSLHEELMPSFTVFFLSQAVVMQFQAFYQRRRHYSLVAQGKASQMDVTNPEGLREYNTTALLVVLVVLLMGTYCFELYLSYSMLHAAIYHPGLQLWRNPMFYKQELQVVFVGAAFAVLAVGNTISLVRTVSDKCVRGSGGAGGGSSRPADAPRPATPEAVADVAAAGSRSPSASPGVRHRSVAKQ
ncbi:hypothetical protein FNF31_05301 [Cafeteria roenbergensis]|uniref:Uncharacterized protein n=1 Tax=Cafeteria roenbergensis TaxID=33653 RepID=A0A5A8D1L4_CAFRO|nr:hypothetical protein FNF31_05301 [Cafeteria roenbergensis]KAA0171874.1 hypothetical protein FNF28_00509 [Cafeteria roenbergensis]